MALPTMFVAPGLMLVASLCILYAQVLELLLNHLQHRCPPATLRTWLAIGVKTSATLGHEGCLRCLLAHVR